MATILFTHESCVDHDPGPMHPDSPARLRAVHAALANVKYANLERREAPIAEVEQIARIHPAAYVEKVLEAIPSEGRIMLDGDTHVSPGSGEAARRAVGALCSAVDAVVGKETNNAFCAVRPPGHHAEETIPMGFCVFNSVAAGAEHARQKHGMERAAVVDFDVHHGNGTQAMFWADAGLFFASTHQMPLYPGTGSASETGEYGNIVNVPLAPFSGSREFRKAMSDRVLPALRSFEPDIIFISAGFDAHAADPLAQLNLVEADYAWITSELLSVADEVCNGRVVSTLEGGYNLDALANSVTTHVDVLI
ncbi:MAG: histone deacetylase family protein, partial [Pseudomonadota bacterium]|nr:histone deacetylase family protein [Pseudomonadota bacterium]